MELDDNNDLGDDELSMDEFNLLKEDVLPAIKKILEILEILEMSEQ